jgi:hypothetical protein
MLSGFTVVQLGDEDFGDTARPSVSSFNNARTGDPSPFNRFRGHDADGGSADFSFTFQFPSGAVDQAVLRLGICDHDSQAPGNQVAIFTLDEVDYTPEMNAVLESRGGAQSEYNVYDFTLPQSALELLADGEVTVGLGMASPGLGDFNNALPFNGAGIDFARLAIPCAINLPPLEVLGDFHHNNQTDRCESTGEVLIGCIGGTQMVRVTGGSVWYDETTLQASGTFAALFNGAWTPLFTGSATADLGGANDDTLTLAGLTTSSLPAAMRPAALPVSFFQIRFTQPAVQLGGAIKLPEFAGGLAIEPEYFGIGASSLTLPTSGSIYVPDVDASLFGALAVKTTGLAGSYDANTDEITLRGEITISLVGSGGPSVSASFNDPGIVIGPTGVDFNGTMSLADLTVVPGVFKLKTLSLTVQVQDSALISIGGAASVELVSQYTVGGSFNIINGELDALSLFGSGLKLPVGTTGLFLQRVSGSVTGLADGGPDPTFTGSVGFSFGPEYDVHLPAAFGGDFEDVSLLSIDLSASATIDFFDFANSDVILQASCAVKLLGGVATGTGSIRMDFRRVELEIDTTFTALAGFITAQSHLSANASLNLSANASAALTVPASVPLIGGTQLFGGRMFFNYAHNGTLADDYIAGYADIATWFGTFRTGARVNFDGTATVLGLVPLSEAPAPGAPPRPQGGPAPAPTAGASRSFTVPAGSRFAVLSAAWANAVAGDVPLRVRGPDGTIYTPANFGAVVDYVDQFTSSKRATVAVHQPMPGTWTIEVPETDPLGAVTFEAFNAAVEPTILFTSPAGAVPGGSVPIQYQGTAPNAGTKVTLFYDTDAQGFDGQIIASNLSAGSNSFTWATAGLAPGAYHVYGVITDNVVPPVFAYAPGTVRVGEDLAAPRIASGTFDFQTRHELRFSFDKDVRDSLNLADLVVTNLDTGQAVPASSFTLQLAGEPVQATSATWLRSSPLPDGNYRVRLPSAAVIDAYGSPLAGGDFTFDFFVLAGDGNRDRRVGFEDLVILAQNYGRTGKTFSQGNFNYDAGGKVDFEDLVLLAQRYGTTLAPPAAAAMTASSVQVVSAQRKSTDRVFDASVPVRRTVPAMKATRVAAVGR